MTVRGQARTPIPVSVLTGFLGAGKTTFLSRLLASPGMADTAVVINEFGEIGLDHLLVETADDEIVELSGGCLCCRVSGDLISTLEDLLRRRDNDRVRSFRRVVIETSGLADPAPMMQAVMLHPYLSLRYRLASVVTVVDGVTGMATLDRHLESVRQVGVADMLVMTKTDLAASAPLAGGDVLVQRLRALNPSAAFLDGACSDFDIDRMFGLSNCAVNPRTDLSPALGRARSHDHLHEHDHWHDARIGAVAVREERPISRAALDGFLDLVRAEYGPGLLRIKGLVLVAGEPDRPLVIHGVQHVLHPPAHLERWPDGERATRIVFITDGVDGGRIGALFDAFVAQGGAAEALGAGNPLATPGTGPYRP